MDEHVLICACPVCSPLSSLIGIVCAEFKLDELNRELRQSRILMVTYTVYTMYQQHFSIVLICYVIHFNMNKIWMKMMILSSTIEKGIDPFLFNKEYNGGGILLGAFF